MLRMREDWEMRREYKTLICATVGTAITTILAVVAFGYSEEHAVIVSLVAWIMFYLFLGHTK